MNTEELIKKIRLKYSPIERVDFKERDKQTDNMKNFMDLIINELLRYCCCIR